MAFNFLVRMLPMLNLASYEQSQTFHQDFANRQHELFNQKD
jgi:hypothetical protein